MDNQQGRKRNRSHPGHMPGESGFLFKALWPCLAFSLALVAPWLPGGTWGQEPSSRSQAEQRFASELNAEQQERLKVRDRYGAQTAKLRREGKQAEAIEAALQMLAIEREVLEQVQGAGQAEAVRVLHADVAGSLEQLADMYAWRALDPLSQSAVEDLAAAHTARHELVSIQIQLYGAKHWHVTDARLALEDSDLYVHLGTNDRALLREAANLNSKVVNLYRAGRSKEALSLAAGQCGRTRRAGDGSGYTPFRRQTRTPGCARIRGICVTQNRLRAGLLHRLDPFGFG